MFGLGLKVQDLGFKSVQAPTAWDCRDARLRGVAKRRAVGAQGAIMALLGSFSCCSVGMGI